MTFALVVMLACTTYSSFYRRDTFTFSRVSSSTWGTKVWKTLSSHSASNHSLRCSPPLMSVGLCWQELGRVEVRLFSRQPVWKHAKLIPTADLLSSPLQLGTTRPWCHQLSLEADTDRSSSWLCCLVPSLSFTLSCPSLLSATVLLSPFLALAHLQIQLLCLAEGLRQSPSFQALLAHLGCKH